MAIDVHAHYFPQAYIDHLGIPYVNIVNTQTPLGDLDLDRRIAIMDEFGVDAQILSVSMTQPYLAEEPDAVVAAQLANDCYWETCQVYHGRLYGLGALPLPHISASLAEIDRCLDHLGMVGISIGTTVRGHYLDDPVFDPIWAELHRRNATLVLHPMGRTFEDSLGDYGLAWRIGALFEDTVAATRLACAHIPARFPGMKVIVPHMGGTIPYHFYRLVRRDPEIEQNLRAMWYDNVNDQPGAIECAVGVLGHERMLYGTDFPWASRDEFRGRLAMFDGLDLTNQQIEDIKHNRACELFGIK